MIIGNTSLEEGDVLNLTCTVESFPLSHVTWTKLGSNASLSSDMNPSRQSNKVSATLLIHNVMVEHSGQYTCEAQHLNTTAAILANVTVTREWTTSFLDLNVMVIDIRKLSANPELTVLDNELSLKSRFPRRSDIHNSLETKMNT